MFYFYLCPCVFTHACVSVHTCCAHGIQKRVLDTLELASQVVMSHSTWVLRTKLGSFVRRASVLTTEPSLQWLDWWKVLTYDILSKMKLLLLLCLSWFEKGGHTNPRSSQYRQQLPPDLAGPEVSTGSPMPWTHPCSKVFSLFLFFF